jgi:hypothetical protein
MLLSSHELVVASHDQVIEGEDGSPLFRIRHQQDSIALLLPIEQISATTLDASKHAVKNILTTSKAEKVPVFREFQLGSA